MFGVLLAGRAELLQLDAVRVVTPVLARDVVAVLAFHARQGDLGTDVRFRHDVPFLVVFVAEAGLEPATQRL